MDKIQEAMASLLSILESGDIEPVARAFFIGGGKPSDSWSFLNRVIMLLAGTYDARGFRQWQKVNRHVIKGAKAFYILGPCKYKVEEEDGEERYVLCGFKPIPVFRLEDTEGEPVNDFELTIPADFSRIVQELGVTIRAVPFEGEWAGAYSSNKKDILLASPDVRTFLHELSHAVDDRIHGNLKGGQHADQEICAEFSAAVIGRMLGYDVPLGNTQRYIKSYSRLSEIAQFFNRIEAIVSFVLTHTAPQSFQPSQEALA